MKASVHSNSGVALVIVLAFLVLLSGLLLAFFSQTLTQRASSSMSANAAATQELADSAVNVVMSQITDATVGQDPNNSDPTTGTLCWASQPGMIRNYDVSGLPKNFYKLYSSDSMVVPGSGFSTATDLPPSDWNSAANAGLYTDLNAPALVADPNGAITPASGSGTFSAVYPIVDPFAEGNTTDANGFSTDGVSGFSMSNRVGFALGNTLPAASYDPTQTTPDKTTANPAAMPVKWLYVLRDGSIVAPKSGGNGTVSLSGASAANPVTGRMAFWTDDDASKVNINTASEGTYWDTPRISSLEDFGTLSSSTSVATPGLSVCQPAQKEFQRYPGHPATTSLSPIFGAYKLPISGSDVSQYNTYYSIAPRIVPGGSNAGTTMPTGQLTTDLDRLYASVDELMFTPLLSGTSRVPNTAGSGSTTPNLLLKATLEKTNFFLTSKSNAPEVTLFNTPRVSIWPVWATSTGNALTVYDQLAAFCGTIGGNNYYFSRTNSRSGLADYAGRNPVLYQYLQALTARTIPGFGGNFLSKYAADRDQILTLIYDYIRCTNLADSSPGAKPFAPIFDAPSVQGNDPNLFHLGAGEVVPIQIGSMRGAGRIYTISEADLLFCATSSTTAAPPVPAFTNQIQAVFLVQFASPMEGTEGMRSSLKYTVKGLDGFTVKSGSATAAQNLKLPALGTNYVEISDVQTDGGRALGGTEGPLQAFWSYNYASQNAKQLTTSGGTTPGNYPFFSAGNVSVFPIPSSSANPTQIPMAFTGGPITIQLYTQDTNELVQTLSMNFPNGTFVVPTMGANGSPATFNARIAGFLPTINYNSTSPNSGLILPQDTLVGVQIAGSNGNATDSSVDNTAGDTRLVAPLLTVNSDRFRTELHYSNSNVKFAHGLQVSRGYGNGRVYGSYQGTLVPETTGSGNYPTDYPAGQANPIIPFRVGAGQVGNGATRSDGKLGDWDTGLGLQPDGSYMNKPDEGDARFTGANGAARIPYDFGNITGMAPPGGTYFSPTRQVPSALMFGSIPTGVQRRLPWQTLMFNPHPEDTTHPGLASPPDHLLADLFWMPVVEPYAISQPFSTAGKINMNYQIVPFTYINRKTAMYSLLKSTKFLALSTSDGPTYKIYINPGGPAATSNRRQTIDIAATLAACDTKFANNDIYKSATEICGLNFVPTGTSASAMATFWSQHTLTGNNVRDKPYVDTYPRLTTKSNTFTVHVCVQALKKSAATAQGGFTDPQSTLNAKDVVLGEYRGSTTIERYIDTNDTTKPLPDFAQVAVSNPSSSALNIDQYYKFRVIETKRFAP